MDKLTDNEVTVLLTGFLDEIGKDSNLAFTCNDLKIITEGLKNEREILHQLITMLTRRVTVLIQTMRIASSLCKIISGKPFLSAKDIEFDKALNVLNDSLTEVREQL